MRCPAHYLTDYPIRNKQRKRWQLPNKRFNKFRNSSNSWDGVVDEFL